MDCKMKEPGWEAEIQKFDDNYNKERCVKCGRRGASLLYNHANDVLLVSCRECGYTYKMYPKKRRKSE